MKLTRLEAYGFKSFAKKLDLKLDGGITAIVGPNGCGKTNVVDAIRWVLGEQRPSMIRLDRMEDVIFKGSGTRRQLGMSEVSLTVENCAGVIPVDLPEITITRRLFRSGESEYMINRKACRLADINDMFMDTGIGTDSYSMIEQKMINAILSDKTEDRRHIFEEAAGITKYKSRRRSALNTLLSIENDINRLGDIITELDRRVTLLKRQASKAERYRKLKSELKARTITLGTFEIDKQRETTVAVSAQLITLESSMEAVRARSSTLTGEIEDLSASLLAVEKELTEIAGRYEANVRSMAERENDITRFESRLESLGEMADRARETSAQNTKALEKLAESHGICADNLSSVNERLATAEADFEATSKQFGECGKEVADRVAAHRNCEQEYRRIERENTTIRAAVDNLKTRREDGEQRLQEIASRSEELGASLEKTEQEITMLEDEKRAVMQVKDEIAGNLARMKKELSDVNGEKEFIDHRLLQGHERQVALKAEIDFLAEVIRSFQGHSEGVRNVVGSDDMRKHVLGVLADVISADDEYVPAIETALATSLQFFLVDASEAGLAGVGQLTEDRGGKAAFLPVHADQTPVKQPAPPSGEGIICPASDVVRAEARFKPIIDRLLEKVILVDSLATALRLHSRFQDYCLVTPSGEMVGRYGDIHGGREREDGTASSIGRREKLEKLRTALSGINENVDTLQKRKAKLQETYDTLKTSMQTAEENNHDAMAKLAEISSHEARARAQRDAGISLKKELEEESRKIRESFRTLDEENRKNNDIIEQNERTFMQLGDQLGLLVHEISTAKEKLEEIRSEMNTAGIERAALREKKVAFKHELDVMGERRESLAHSSRQLLREIEEAEAEILRMGENKKESGEILERLTREHADFGNSKIELERRYTELRSLRAEKERARQDVQQELVELSKKESGLILEKEEASLIMSNIIERLCEDFFITRQELPSGGFDPGFKPESEKLLLGELRKKIHLIGDVNLTAEAEYSEEKKRLAFLQGEYDDLTGARDTLIETVSRINIIARARFMDTLDQIRSNFSKTFQNFFNGGICDLALEEGGDPLEANIVITARPPGKNVRSISLLSSGERALTAISLLFSIYMVKPSPFCILDEVDAPLDDANIDRFLHVIKEFSKKTQFVMVTHNKKSMAQADNLYGITMNEPGLSHLVTVRLSEVDTYSYERTTGVQSGMPADSDTVTV